MKAGGKSKGCAYVDFAGDADVEKALEQDKALYRGLHLFVARSDPARAAAQKKEARKAAPRPRRADGGAAPATARRHGGGDAPAARPAAERPHERIGAPVLVPRAAAGGRKAASNSDFKAMMGL